MLKAVKECMKNWLVTHERLYWYIVVGLAVLGFGIVTAMGMAKLEKANAAAEITVNAPEINYDTLPTYQQVVDAVVETFGVSSSEVTAENTVMFTSDGDAYIVFYGADIAKLECYGLANGCNINAKSSVTRISINVVTDTVTTNSFNGSFMGIYNTRNEYQGYVWGAPIYCWERNGTMPILTPVTDYPLRASYSLDAPYINFQKVVVDNKITDYYFNPRFFDSFYETYTKASSWKYFGKLNNMDVEKDREYLLECEFLVQLPTADYVLGQYEAHDIDIEWESNVIKYGADLVHEWNMNKKAPFVEYSFIYNFSLVPDENGNFTYQMSFDEIELLIKYFNEEFRTEWNEYSDYFRSVLLSYIHVECVTASVKTTRDDCIVYGKICTNQFTRGIYDTCIEVIPEIDINTATPEEIDKILSDAVENAHNQYIKDLEGRLEDLENQINGNTSVQMGFGNLEGSDLWTGFVGLTQGIGGMAPAVQSLSALTGSILAFLPLQMSSIMATTMLAICVIAIIKAIRG